MSIINKVGVLSPDNQIKNNRNEKGPTRESKKFESQFLEMVEKVENMGSEIDAMIETTNTQNPTAVQKGVNKVGSYIKSIEGLVEDFSVKNADETDSRQIVKNPYTKSNKV